MNAWKQAIIDQIKAIGTTAPAHGYHVKVNGHLGTAYDARFDRHLHHKPTEDDLNQSARYVPMNFEMDITGPLADRLAAKPEYFNQWLMLHYESKGPDESPDRFIAEGSEVTITANTQAPGQRTYTLDAMATMLRQQRERERDRRAW